jgi:uncharacterized protein (TIGR02217 family)
MFLETPRFPACPSFGFTAEPMYSVTAVQFASGRERRNRNWQRALHRFTATVGPRAEDEIAEVLEFWHAVGGSAYGFRFRDGVDHLSCAIHETPGPTDQLMILDTDASPDAYQLVKDYAAGALSQRREIYKPVAGTIRVADNAVEKTEGADWTLDETTGLVTLNFSPAGTLTWGGEFDVPVRFDSELPIELAEYKIQSCQFVLRELRL